ncbi:DegT/DnrJ/EryC1/StrS aminotransferase family protein [Pseudomonas sp. BGI-2]|uniref:DegT/DnrJ/EryC1/StrS family aminotransferase n=1 Tax=Pseudomonas sp. BGI-2 TaxID=2528211 RepID=UPI0010349774|nr:DegT/DnrJ/EryC1/StrS family aminotransferase [Pseudomonas sp. BGI-2]TBN43360.1 pyridoxal-phosphate-dependent/plp-dependent aminotransferase [Pseudomonas sp. BGI-2]
MTKTIPLYGVVNLPAMEMVALDVLRSGRLASGEFVSQFETRLSDLVGLPNVVTTIDMTSALFLALHLAEVSEGDEVLTCAFACLSTNSAIAQCHATPVWVDFKPMTVEMDIADLESKISPRTKAVILYHVAGYPGPAREIAALCKKHNIILIEDCDNALFAARDSTLVGSHGDFAIFSFYPNRQINTAEGGALVCKNNEMADRARKLRRFGINFNTFRGIDGEINAASDIPEIGWGITLNNLCCALGCAQLDSVKNRYEKTTENVRKLRSLIENIEGIEPVSIIENGTPAYWVFLLFAYNRDEVISFLKSQGIMASAIHQRNDIYSGFGVTKKIQLPNTDYLQNHIIGVPCGWWLGEQEIEQIANALVKASSLVMADKNVNDA